MHTKLFIETYFFRFFGKIFVAVGWILVAELYANYLCFDVRYQWLQRGCEAFYTWETENVWNVYWVIFDKTWQPQNWNGRC